MALSTALNQVVAAALESLPPANPSPDIIDAETVSSPLATSKPVSKGKRGGARPGAGRRRKGEITSLVPSTLQAMRLKEAARYELRSMVRSNLKEMVSAQIAHAKGTKYLAYRDTRSGRWVKVTDAMLEPGKLPADVIIEVFEREPSATAFADLMNRTIDKPAEHVELSGKDGSPLVLRWER